MWLGRFFFRSSTRVGDKASARLSPGIIRRLVGASFLAAGPSLLLYGRGRFTSVGCESVRTESPTYTSSDVGAHDCVQTRVWVSYDKKVYDITDFVKNHPGGEIIMQSAGKALEPFFEKYIFHKSSGIIVILEEYLIGNLAESDWYSGVPTKDDKSVSDEFSHDPIRDARLEVVSQRPFNAETPIECIPDNFFTPNELFFVRNHMPVPNCSLDDYYLDVCFQKDLMKEQIDGRDERYFVDTFSHFGVTEECTCRRFTFDQLQSEFCEHQVAATLQCSGNRRSEMDQVKSVQGLRWKGGAISNAMWSGFRLRDVMLVSGFDPEKIQASGSLHARFTGFDHNASGESYEASVPLSVALNPDTLFASRMNGQTLSADHGYPLRVISPGVTGARNVKWIKRVLVSDEESPSRWQRDDYRCFMPDQKPGDPTKDKGAPPIYYTPITSFVCRPRDGAVTRPDNDPLGRAYVTLEGYAFGGGGTGVARVEVSVDGGQSWFQARLERGVAAPHDRSYSWVTWSCDVPVQSESAELQVVCRAVDSSYNRQPESPAHIWNARGLLNNSWHRTHVVIQQQHTDDPARSGSDDATYV